ncbi:MAG: hypothetical protein LBR21_03735, partial [Propionibacteriaceae bacterium]|nr:hypothetical protein [Propionibacteriaceae bacterium]
DVDFVAERGDERLDVQVTASLTASDEVRARELAPLLAIRGSYPKLLLSPNQLAAAAGAGISHEWLPTWMAGG